MMNLMPYFIAWGVLAIIALALAVMRRQISAREDDSLHLAAGEAAMVTEQVEIAKKLEVIDKWGKLVTIVLTVSGIALGSVWAIRIWEEGSRATFEK